MEKDYTKNDNIIPKKTTQLKDYTKKNYIKRNFIRTN